MQRQREIFAVTLSLVLGFVIIQLTAPSCRGPDPTASAPLSSSAGGASEAGANGPGLAGERGASLGGRPFAWPSAADVVSRVMPSVVYIASTRAVKGAHVDPPSFDDPFFGPGGREGRARPEHELSVGSGVIVGADGLILTNHHVIERAEDLQVSLSDGRTYSARLVGSDPASDLALIRLTDPPRGLVPIELGDSTRLRLGDFVLAIGNPFGVGETVTFGMVSAKGRADLGLVDYEDFIQTDAAINPGNSGGALVDLSGKLVGINTAILSSSGGYQGIGFAIPVEMAKPIADELRERGKVVRGWLGITVEDLGAHPASARPEGLPRGVVVADVTAGAPGARAGLEAGDLVVAIDGEVVTSSGMLRNAVARRGAGARVELLVVRKQKEKMVHATLGELPAPPVEHLAGWEPARAEAPERSSKDEVRL